MFPDTFSIVQNPLKNSSVLHAAIGAYANIIFPTTTGLNESISATNLSLLTIEIGMPSSFGVCY